MACTLIRHYGVKAWDNDKTIPIIDVTINITTLYSYPERYTGW